MMEKLDESLGPDLRLELDVAIASGQELLDFLEKATVQHHLTYGINTLKGPGGGWPCIEFIGKRSNLKAFYLGLYGGDEEDFEEFLKLDNDLKESIVREAEEPEPGEDVDDDPALGSVTLAIHLNTHMLGEFLEQVSDDYNISYDIKSFPKDGEDVPVMVQFSGLYGDLQSFYDQEIKEPDGDDDEFDDLFELDDEE